MIDPNVEKILEVVLDHTEKVIDIDRFYVALYNPVTAELDFPLAVRKSGGKLERLKTGTERWRSRSYEPRERLPDYLLAEGKKGVLVAADFEDWRTAQDLQYETRPRSWLGVPLIARGRAIGAIVVEHYMSEHAYDERARDLMYAIANRASGALANARLVKSLRTVNEVGQRLASGIRLSVDEILSLVYAQAGQLMDTRDMYIALYDAGQRQLSFPLAMQDGERRKWPSRPAREGPSSEEVIDTKKPLLIANYQAWYEERGLTPPIAPEKPPKSWLGVPMMSGNRVLGVIAVQNDEVENLYGPDDQEVLQTMANQAAVALENAERTRDWQAARERATAAEKLALMSQVAAEFAHRMNNLAGTIPVRINLAKEKLSPGDPRDAKVIQQLDGIAGDTQLLLQAAQEIKQSAGARVPEDVAIAELLEIAIGRVWSSQPDVEDRVTVETEFANDLPTICVERNRLLDTLVSVIRNGVEAIQEEGELTVIARRGSLRGKPCVEIAISDTGVGIAIGDLPKIFDLFFTTKEEGLGFGLWRDRTFIKELGGDVEVESEVGKGTTFAMMIPLEEG